MEAFQLRHQPLSSDSFLMNPIPSILRPALRLASTRLGCFSTSSPNPTTTHDPIRGSNCRKSVLRGCGRVAVNLSDAHFKEKWLDSLACPFPERLLGSDDEIGIRPRHAGSEWVIGVDPDVSGALAVLKPGDLGCSAQVFDSPYLKVLVGKKLRRRLDAKAIVVLLQSLNAPPGTLAYLEQSTPYPQDGKQGWWGGGFGYGLWIGVLVASGFSVVPVPSLLWKNEFKLSGSRTSKDDSRELASKLFPPVSSQLRRKKDHGRAEALLIAAYGKGIKLISDTAFTLEEHRPNSNIAGRLFDSFAASSA